MIISLFQGGFKVESPCEVKVRLHRILLFYFISFICVTMILNLQMVK